ncbi:hypothetical protein P8452_19432 [Trifolium repens]|nr:hypothetical protein P8452_19432 [Trifolium repens]
MASITMSASILGCPVVTNRSTVATPRRLVVKAVRSVEGEKMVRYENEKECSKNGRRNLMFAAVAAAVCSVGGVAMADDEPKREQRAAAAAANIKSLLPLLPSLSLSWLTIFSPSTARTALTTSLLCVATVERLVTAGQPKIAAVMVIDAIFTM